MIFVSDWYFEKRGQQYGLRYDEIEGMIKVFMEFISGLIKLSQDVKKLPDTLRAKIKDFQLKYRKACGTRYPYSYCKYICINQACLYRYHSEALLQDPFLESKFNRAMREKDQIRWNMLARLGKLAVERMLSPLVSRKSLKKPALCFLMHKAMNKAYIGPYQQEIFMERAYEIFEEK